VRQDVENVEDDVRLTEVAADVHVAGAGRLGQGVAGPVDAVRLAVGVEVAERAVLDEAVDGSVVVVPARALPPMVVWEMILPVTPGPAGVANAVLAPRDRPAAAAKVTPSRSSFIRNVVIPFR
jgi:hypothetical protein